MAAEVSSDVNFINDEDVLRRMWQQTEDFGRKKEIRARMYKLREQRLREFYTTGEVVDDTMASRKHTGTTHADSISDQGFLTMKTKEIRDSESPTREIQRRTCDNNYWNTVQQSSYSTADEGNTISDNYTLTTTGHGVSEDGSTKMNLAAQEKGFQSSTVYEDDTTKSASEQRGLSTEKSSSSHKKTDNGEITSSSTSKQHQEQKSFVSSNKDSSFSSTKWETSSSSSSSRKIVSSSSNYEIVGNTDVKAITSADDSIYVDQSNKDSATRDSTDFVQSTTRHVTKNSSHSVDHDKGTTHYETTDNSSKFIDNEIRRGNNEAVTKDFQNKTVDKKTYKTELTSTVQDYNIDQDVYQSKPTQREYTKPETENVVVDQKIMTELQKLDSFLSTQNTGTSTPVSPHSVTSDAANWTIVSNTDGEFVYRGDKVNKVESKIKEPQQPKRELIKQPSSLDLPKDTTEGQYVTTYQEHYTNKRISVDNSPTHDAFARSLRQSPPASRSSSKVSLDRSSPERKQKSSPRTSPDKERRVSVGSYTIEKTKESPKRKTSETTRQSNVVRDTKPKRKFSSTQTKAASKTRASTPGASPETSPTRQQRGRTTSPSSQSDSDASQVTYDKSHSTTIKRTDVTKRKLEESFDDENIKKEFEEDYIVNQSRTPGQDKPLTAKSPQETTERKISGILRKESKGDIEILSKNVNSSEVIQTTETTNVALSNARKHMTSPEYSSEGSVGKEIKIRRSPVKESKPSPDSSPERSAFTPIKCFRTSPEVNSLTQEININVHHFGVDDSQDTTREEREPTKPETPISTRKQSTPDSGMQSPNSDAYRRTPSPSKTVSPTRRESSPMKQEPIKKSPSPTLPSSRRPSSPDKSVSPTRTILKKTSESTTTHTTSPTKSESPSTRAKSPPKGDNINKMEPIRKSEARPQSPKKELSPRKPSIPKQEPIQTKEMPSRNKSPESKNSSPIRRASSPQTGVIKRPRSPEKSPSPNRRSPSPIKQDSIKKQRKVSSEKNTSPSYRSPSPTKPRSSPSPKEKSPRTFNSPERFSNSPSVSPCSSPERPSDRKTTVINITPVRKPTTGKSPVDSKPESVRTTRRSSIPRAEQTSTVVRKTLESKVEVHTKPVSKIPSSVERRPKPGHISQTVRTSSQSSIDKQTVTKNYKTTVRKTVEKPREIVKKTPTKTVKTTAIITLQKPNTPNTPVKKTNSVTTRVNQTIKKFSLKDTTPNKLTASNKKPVEKLPQTINTKRTPANTSPTTKQPRYEDSQSDRSTMSSPETVQPSQPLAINQEQTIGFIERIRQDEITQHDSNTNVALSFICGNEKPTELTDRTINLEFIRNNIEDETLPEGFPEPEYEDESPKVETESVHEISRKTINVEGKRQASNTFMVTVKKPTGTSRPTTTTKTIPANKNVTGRSSSGPIRPSPSKISPTTNRSTTPVKKSTPINKPETFNRSSSDKTIIKPSMTKRQTSKPELKQTNKTNKQITETGIATRTVTAAKTATIKRSAVSKKKITETKHEVTSSSSSEDEEDIPSVEATYNKEQSYIDELEELRREEEAEYASKVTAATNKENMLLNVIVQHPKSSRESSPDYSSRGQPFCAVSDDGGSHPRLADMVIEPEDVEVFDVHKLNKAEKYNVTNERSFEQITDLDEESEVEDIKLNVSVADRVSQFIETTKHVNATPVREEPCAPVPSDGPKSVLKAKNMFENIAKNQMAPPAPNNKPVDILSRPSIFEARRGETAPKNINYDTFPRRRDSKSPEQVQRRNSYDDISKTDEELYVNVEENTQEYPDSFQTPTNKPSFIPEEIDDTEPTNLKDKLISPVKDDFTNKTPIAKDQSPNVKETPVRKLPQERKTELSSVDSKVSSERTVSKTSNEISSKKAFFERKAQAQTVTASTKETFRKTTPKKSTQIKHLQKEFSPDRKSVQTDFINNERKSSRTSPERKTSVPASPTKEKKPFEKDSSPDIKRSFGSKTKDEDSSLKKTPQRKDSPERFYTRPTKERKESPERHTSLTSPDTRATFKDKKPFSRDSPERSTVQDRKAKFSRESPERSVVRDRPAPSRDSPDRSVFKNKTPLNRESPDRSQVKDRKPSIQRESPERTVVKDRRPSANRESPDRSPVKDRKSSIKRESPERTVVKDGRPSTTRESPDRSPERDRRPTANRESPEKTPMKTRKTSLNRESPERSPTKDRRTSLNRESPGKDTELSELNKAGKFGVTLRRTSSTGSGCSIRRPSIPGESKEIEDIFELELLEQLMEKAVGYEQRRRIRSQIRIVKKSQDDKTTKNHKVSVSTRSATKTPTRIDSPTREPSAKPDKSPLNKPSEAKYTPTEVKKPSPTVQRPVSPVKNRESSPELKSPLTNGYHKAAPKRNDSPDRKSPQRSPQSPLQRRDTSPQRTETSVRRGSKTENTVEITTVRTQKRTETLQEKGVDSITSSYGVGPTDENGRPLFGLRALRRSNTNKTFTDEPEEPAVIEKQPEPEVCDARGRPLFGLKALQTSIDVEEMPEQPGTPQLKDLVLRHEKKAHDTNNPERDPIQKPKARLRDSFILTQEEEHKASALEEFNSSQRGLSLRSIIQKHEDIAQSGGTVKREMASSTTVVSSKSTVSSDGSVTLNKEVIEGELSSKNGEEPVGKVTRTEYSYKSPHLEDNDKAVSKVTTTTTHIGNRRQSGPKITEIEDEDSYRKKIKSINDRRLSLEQEENEEITQKKTSTRRSSVQKDDSESTTKSSIRRFSGQKITDDLQNGDDHNDENVRNKGYSGKSVISSTVTTNVRKFSSPKIVDEINEDIVQQKSSSRVSSSTTTSTVRRTDSAQVRSRTPTSITKQTSKDDEESQSPEDKKKGLARGDSVRALQHKFQQATETASSPTQKNFPRAGLILRSSSFKTTDELNFMSSKQKQASIDKNRQSPDKSSPTVRSQTTESTVSRRSRISDNIDDASTAESNYKTTTSRVTETTSTTTTSKSSFLDNNTRVTGVQDILDRMRNADLVVESSDTSEDTEARALLNKFLGASVILQGMEQGMKATGQSTEITDITPGSAALVSRVEKQRMATSTQKQEDIENIWDEKQLRTLLEACSDYEGRRQIRARLRTVMAEHKACADVVAVTGQHHGGSTLSQGECALVLPSSLMRSHSSQSSCVDDSGTESGEDFRLLSPEILAEVQRALIRLEGALPGLDPVRREALIQLVNRLQSCLKLQPPNPTPPHPPPRRFAKRLSRQNRHTVGVSKEELADARKWLQEAGLEPIDTSVFDLAQFQDKKSSNSLSNLSTQNVCVPTKVFRPVIFNPNLKKSNLENNVEQCQEVPNQVPIIEQEYSQPKLHRSSVDYIDEPIPLAASLSFNGDKRELQEIPVVKADSGSSLLEYDPSLALFTPAQSVQIAVHKAAINKQISLEESKRERKNLKESITCSHDSDDGDISSTEEEQALTVHQDLDECVSSAQRLLQIASDNQKKQTPGRFHAKNNKKLKMKRANTIDIPKPCLYDDECSSGEEFGKTSADEVQNNNENTRIRSSSGDRKITQLPFEPKTESDMKFLAFLNQTKGDNYKAVTYNPSARGGKPWNNRFTNIKTAFEQPVNKENNAPPPKKSITPVNQQWPINNSSDQPVLRQAVQNRSPQPLQTKLPWTEQDEGDGVVYGSLTVAKKPSGIVNQFSHAPKSAFKPIEKKPLTPSYQPTPSGTVKQLATNTFSGNNVPMKPVVKHYSVAQDKVFNQSTDFGSLQYNPVYHPKQSDYDRTSHNQNNQQKVIFDKSQIGFVEQYSPDETRHLDKVQKKTKAQMNYDNILDSEDVRGKYNREYMQHPLANNNEPSTKLFSSSSATAHKHYELPKHQAESHYRSPKHDDFKLSEYSPPKQYIYSPPTMGKAYNHPPQFDMASNNQEVQNFVPLSPQKLHNNHPDLSSGMINYPSSKPINPSTSQSIKEGQKISSQNKAYSPVTYANPNLVSRDGYPSNFSSAQSQNQSSWQQPPFQKESQYTAHSPPKIKTISLAHSISQDSDPSPTPNSNIILFPQDRNQSEFNSNSSPSGLQYARSPYLYDDSNNSSFVPSPLTWNKDEEEYIETRSSPDGLEMQTAVTRVMGHAQCQQAVTVAKRTKHRYDDDNYEKEVSAAKKLGSELRLSVASKSKSPSPFNSDKIETETQPQTASKTYNQFSQTFKKLESEQRMLAEIKTSHAEPKKHKQRSVENYSNAKSVSMVTNSAANAGEVEARLQVPIKSPATTSLKNISTKFEPNTQQTASKSILRKTEASCNSPTKKNYPDHLRNSPKIPGSISPSFPSVLQKSESWHQLVKEQIASVRQQPPKSPRLPRAKSSHSLAFPKQFEASLTPDVMSVKQSTIDQYLKQTEKKKNTETKKHIVKVKQKKATIVKLDDDLENVDEAFESLFIESSRKSSKSSESKQVMTKGEGSTVTRTEVHTRTVSSSNRLTKANSVSSPFAKFKQLERQNSVPSSGSAPLFKFTDPKLVRSASTIKERLLNWVQAQTKDYKNIQIDNFSTSWSNGLAFCALIHHFCPDAFDYDKLTPEQRRHNFELAFRVAEEEAGIAPLLDVEDMVVMRRPDWKCVFTYVQSIYRHYHATPESVRY